MTTIFGLLGLGDLVIIAIIVFVLAGSAAYSTRSSINAEGLHRRLNSLHRKVDLLLKKEGIAFPPPEPSGLSAEVEQLALQPNGKIEAIRCYREQNPGVGLAEAKHKIEEFLDNRR